MPYSTAFGDHFYCQTDGRLECGHVFLSGNGLPDRWHESSGTFRIGELGFGTGLNACETWRQWKETRTDGRRLLHFVSFELFPMQKPKNWTRALSRWSGNRCGTARRLSARVAGKRRKASIDIALDDQTRLTVLLRRRASQSLDRSARSPSTLGILDGFRPFPQSGHVVAGTDAGRCIDHTVPGGSFATYAAAGFVRRNLMRARDLRWKDGRASRESAKCSAVSAPAE